jgi:type I restriction enzyme R subunit
MKFNEDSRVKIPSILYLIQLGYNYLSLKNNAWDISANIFTDIFYSQLKTKAKTIRIKRLVIANVNEWAG